MNRIDIKISDGVDGYTRSIAKFGDMAMELVRIPRPPHDDSEAVRAAMIELSAAIVRQMLIEAMPAANIKTETIVDGVPLDASKH